MFYRKCYVLSSRKSTWKPLGFGFFWFCLGFFVWFFGFCLFNFGGFGVSFLCGVWVFLFCFGFSGNERILKMHKL